MTAVMADDGVQRNRRSLAGELCEVCGRFALLEWHSFEHDHADTMECSADVGGQGMWLCRDSCHRTAHELMTDAEHPMRAGQAVVEMQTRLARAVGPGRKYRRKKK